MARAEADHTQPGWMHVVLAATGALGMALIVMSACMIGAHGPTDSGLERAVVDMFPAGAAGDLFGALCVGVGLLLVISAWLVLGLLLQRGAPLRPLYRITALWAAPLVIGPPIFSRDVYSYAAQGLMVNRHFSPYYFGPSSLWPSHFLQPVSHTWLDSASPYGPLFLRLSSTAVRIGGESIINAVLLLRLVEIVGVVLLAVWLPKLAIACGRDPGRAVWLGVCNPLVLFHFVGGAHNDALMVGLLVAGLAVAMTGRPMLGVLLCTLAATIKAPAAIPVLFILVDTVRRAPSERRLAELARLGAVGAVGFAFVASVTNMGWGWVHALGVPGTNRSLLTPTTFVAHWISDVIGHDAFVLALVRGVGMLVALAGIAYLVWRAPKIGMVRACGLALALVVALGPIVLPWYALWSMILLAAAGKSIERGFAIFATVVLALMVQPSGSSMPDFVLMAGVITLTGVALACAWRPVRTWITTDVTAALEEYNRRGRLVHDPELWRLALSGFLKSSRGS